MHVAGPGGADTVERAAFARSGRRQLLQDLVGDLEVGEDVLHVVVVLERAAIEAETGTRLADTRLRIEYCQDAPGFWLEPHTDIAVKRFTMLVYLLDDAALKLAGTDIHEGPPDYAYVATAPYGRNLGVIFIPGSNTWHGVGHHPLKALRKSIIINYVAPDWRDTFELA